MKCYKVFDEEIIEVFGEKQLIDFAMMQADCLDEYDLENLSDELREKIEKNKELSIEDAFKILDLRAFDIEEIEIF